MSEFEETLKSLANLSFEGKAESFVEQKFLTPLLGLLGYESHKDYEVIRHGDDGSSFKLKCPPVANGNKKTKNYHPDYIPTIRKKTFWVIEAKSPKSDEINKKESIVQGLQYCVHPEIQAKYLFLSDGQTSKIFDIQENYFFDLDGDIYEPILTFSNTELPEKWGEIFNLFSPEKIRVKLEHDLIMMYEKICLSSLDESYPKRVSAKISLKISEIKREIQENLNRLRCEHIEQHIENCKDDLSKMMGKDLLFYMEYPFEMGGVEAVPAVYYVRRLLEKEKSVDEIFDQLTSNYEKQTVFRKQNTFVGLCKLHGQTKKTCDKEKIKDFLFSKENLKMSAFNKAETAVLRINKKLFMVNLFGHIQKKLEAEIKHLPEIIRFVNPPNALQQINPDVLSVHRRILPGLRKRTEKSCEELAKEIEQMETSLEQEWRDVLHKISKGQRELFGVEYYGLGDNVDGLENIMENLKINK